MLGHAVDSDTVGFSNGSQGTVIHALFTSLWFTTDTAPSRVLT